MIKIEMRRGVAVRFICPGFELILTVSHVGLMMERAAVTWRTRPGLVQERVASPASRATQSDEVLADHY